MKCTCANLVIKCWRMEEIQSINLKGCSLDAGDISTYRVYPLSPWKALSRIWKKVSDKYTELIQFQAELQAVVETYIIPKQFEQADRGSRSKSSAAEQPTDLLRCINPHVRQITAEHSYVHSEQGTSSTTSRELPTLLRREPQVPSVHANS